MKQNLYSLTDPPYEIKPVFTTINLNQRFKENSGLTLVLYPQRVQSGSIFWQDNGSYFWDLEVTHGRPPEKGKKKIVNGIVH